MKSETRNAYLHAMGIHVWQRRSTAASATAFPDALAAPRSTRGPSAEANPAAPASETYAATSGADAAPVTRIAHQHPPSARQPEEETASWATLQAEVRACTACKLHQGRTQTVFGVGDHRAQWMIIGEAPGAEEDVQGEPFVGRAGKLLNEMLFAVGLQREQVYIANIVKCRPPNNREPQPDEAAACAHYLRAQIDLMRPKLIICVGRIAATNLLGTHPTLGQYRGKLHRYADTDIPVVVTYHPAYLLRNPLDKRRAWQDLQFAISVCRPSAQ